MAAVDPPPLDVAANLDAVRAALDCREVRRATARLRQLRRRQRPLDNRRRGHRCVGRQHRTHVPGCGLVDTLVPAAHATPSQHIAAAVLLDHPTEGADAGLDADCRDAIDLMASGLRDRAGFLRQREADMAEFGRVERLLRETRRRVDEIASPAVRGMIQRVNIPLLHAAVAAAECPSGEALDLAPLFAVGFPTVGDIPPSGWWTPADLPACRDLADEDNEAWHNEVERLLRTARTRLGAPEEMAAVLAGTRAEVDAGLMRGPFTRAELDDAYGKGAWREMVRFGVWQRGKLRGCDNAKGSLHNEGTTRHEQLVCDSADFPTRVARALADACAALGIEPPLMKGGTDDLAAAYRHVPTDSPHMTVVAVLDPDTGEAS